MRHSLWLCWLFACGSEAAIVEPVIPAPSPPVARPAERASDSPPSLVGRALDTSHIAGIEQWYVPPGEEGNVDVVVFFEVWCPHCKQEMPHLATLDAMPGVDVLALTRQSRGVTDDIVRNFIGERDLTFGVGKVDEQLAVDLGIRGVPRAVVVKGGEIVWDGHPGKLDEEALRGWL